MSWKVLVSSTAIVALLAGCAGSASRRAVPGAEAPLASPAGEQSEPEDREQAPAPSPAEASSPRFARPPGAEPAPDLAARPAAPQLQPPWNQLLSELAQAEADLLASSSSCEHACRALRSMQRAAARLCALASDDDSAARCRYARERLRDARRLVRDACRTCPDGTAVDPDAPIDSAD